jgi:DNA-binding transcriptional LysR family regulator
MPTRPSNAAELRLADLHTFLTIVRSGSLSGAARALGVTPSQASKAVTRLEEQVRVRLLVRGTRGVQPSAAGLALMPRFEDVLARVNDLAAPDAERGDELTIVASSYVSALLVPEIAAAGLGVRLRSLELPPGIASAYATGNAFDMALTTGSELWPKSWSNVAVGTLRKGVFASPAAARALGAGPISVERIRGAPFICPIYTHNGQVVSGDDGSPLPRGVRRIGHQTQTVAVALELASRSDQLVFSPALSARPFVERGALVEIPVEGWDVGVAIYLACDVDRVRARVARRIRETLRRALA